MVTIDLMCPETKLIIKLNWKLVLCTLNARTENDMYINLCSVPIDEAQKNAWFWLGPIHIGAGRAPSSIGQHSIISDTRKIKRVNYNFKEPRFVGYWPDFSLAHRIFIHISFFFLLERNSWCCQEMEMNVWQKDSKFGCRRENNEEQRYLH